MRLAYVACVSASIGKLQWLNLTFCSSNVLERRNRCGGDAARWSDPFGKGGGRLLVSDGRHLVGKHVRCALSWVARNVRVRAPARPFRRIRFARTLGLRARGAVVAVKAVNYAQRFDRPVRCLLGDALVRLEQQMFITITQPTGRFYGGCIPAETGSELRCRVPVHVITEQVRAPTPA